MQRQWIHITVLLKRLAIVFGLFFLCRIGFYLFNLDLFPFLDLYEFIGAALIGMQYDFAAVLIINTVFILLHLLPHPWREKARFQKFLKIKYYLVNGGFLLLEAGDFIYFRYASERTSSHLLGLRHDIINLIPQFFLDFWYMILGLVVILFVVERLYKRTSIQLNHRKLRTILFVAAFVVFIFGSPALLLQGEKSDSLLPDHQASFVVDASELPLVSNTTYTVIQSIWNRQLRPRKYLPDDVARTEVEVSNRCPEHTSLGKALRGEGSPNVMVIMMESFSSEYIGYFNKGKGYTPFLDSLLGQSIVFENAYANGKHSIDAVTSITMGLPPLMTDPFISSPYFENNFKSVAHYLKDRDYRTYFFHGAMDKTMQLNKYLPKAGFDGYIGMKEYNNLEDYDGSWGIYDEPFMQFAAQQLDTIKQPFCSFLFSLSSHHPFTLPTDYQDKFKGDELPIFKTVSYSDHALEQFFQTASTMDWFDNTIFILTADHTGPSFKNEYKTRLGVYDIPIAIYKPNSNISYHSNKVVQQTDIMPTILDICGIDREFSAFGNTMLSNEPGYAISAMNGIYQLVWKDYLLHFNGEEVVGLYHIPTDPLVQHNIFKEPSQVASKMERMVKAIIQQYHNMMINDKLVQ